jgi:hypothetical protein
MKVNFNLNKKQISEFRHILQSNDNLLNQNEIFKICKPASYLVYYLKEVAEYFEKLEYSDFETINNIKKLRRELHFLNKEEVKYFKYI